MYRTGKSIDPETKLAIGQGWWWRGMANGVKKMT
jgi:hypothetical protein